jgi:hypothetical protein
VCRASVPSERLYRPLVSISSVAPAARPAYSWSYSARMPHCSCRCSSYSTRPPRCSCSAARPTTPTGAASAKRSVGPWRGRPSAHLLLQLRCLDADSGSEEAALGYDAWCKCTFQMFQTYVTSFSYGCCKSGSGCCICCNGCTRMLQASVPNVSSIFSDVCCKCVYMDVTYLSHICCKRFICMLRIFQ